MNNQDYEKAKQECWTNFVYRNKDEIIDKSTNGSLMFAAYTDAFDRAYHLGMEDAEKEEHPKPKFKVGDKVIIHGVDNYLMCGKVGVIKKLPDEIEPFNYKIDFEEGKYTYLSEKHLEPYIEPQEDKDFDNIVKDSFRNELRLNIAATILQGMLSNFSVDTIKLRTDLLIKLALGIADALLEESQKGGSK